jgi:hypothetical protein
MSARRAGEVQQPCNQAAHTSTSEATLDKVLLSLSASCALHALYAYLFTDALVGANEPTRVTDRAIVAKAGKADCLLMRALWLLRCRAVEVCIR